MKYNLFFDGRYICGYEAAYRIFGFNIHYRSLAVERLSFHLEGNKYCTFRSNEPIEKIAEREEEKYTQLEAYFFLNETDANARQFLYDEIPQHYVWNDADRLWTPRKRGKKIGRLAYTHHSSGELWYLRLLLTKVRVATSFNALKTVKGKLHDTYQEACKEYGLLDDDNEWDEVLQECVESEIHTLLKSIGKSLKDYSQMPQPPSTYLDCGINNLIIEETSYDTTEMQNEFDDLYSNCNTEQLKVFDSVMDSIDKKEGGVFFVYGSGGCGKTYLWRTLISRLRSEKKIVLPVASSGITATLMPGGRTAHTRFKIPIVLDDHSMCSISHTSDIAELIKRTELIIWDEAPMQHRYSFECLDRSLKDIMKAVDPKRFNLPFGGITVVFGGDFRQILPVIPRSGHGEVVASCITNSKIWRIATVFKLVHNMRLNKGRNQEEVQALTTFAKWVLDVGDGNIPRCTQSGSEDNEDDISIPLEFCNMEYPNSVDEMIKSTYPHFMENYQNPD
ncbi:uncharacterized protein LOC108203994 [Daucus carota subsp. sativus]|uniref:uncharacterized protein LOC108203994 n=1 Tax=Daucus carota subsp. sativus TaxID=79200 RepID=UPI0007F02173|nr:PREDICTED: uncharacterized protein LOC108203994 [Daucus carota subsp. sativus]